MINKDSLLLLKEKIESYLTLTFGGTVKIIEG